MNFTKTTDIAAYWMAYAAFRDGKDVSEAVGEALYAIADKSGLEGDEMVNLTMEVIGSAQLGWGDAKVIDPKRA